MKESKKRIRYVFIQNSLIFGICGYIWYWRKGNLKEKSFIEKIVALLAVYVWTLPISTVFYFVLKIFD